MSIAASSVSTYVPFFKKINLLRVLDYGAGKLRNTKYLYSHGFKVYVADVPHQLEKIEKMPFAKNLESLLCPTALSEQRLNVDFVISTFVLNIIHDVNERNKFLTNTYRNLRDNGFFLVEVKCKEKANSCELCKQKLCTNAFSLQELDDLVLPIGFKRCAHRYGKNSLGVLYQKISNEAN